MVKSMGRIKNGKLFQKIAEWKKRRQVEQTSYEDDWTEITYSRKELDMHDKYQRQEYVENCLEQMVDAVGEMGDLTEEYSTVTSYLKDMEEIEALPELESSELKASAEKIAKLEGQRGVYLEKKSRMSGEKFHQMERIEDEAEDGCRKLAEAEDLQGKIRQDMSRLDGEKHAYQYRKSELRVIIADTKGIAIICSVALVLCFIVLLVLQYGMNMNTQTGFLLTAGIAVLVIAFLYFKYMESVKELKRVERGINKIILLQNRAKIRYVNNTNLLDYYYLKYMVSSAKELQILWEKYIVEKEERKKYREAEMELDGCQQELLSILKCYPVKDPAIWLHQTAAILDSKEMVEIRHNLIVRRQSLRRRMDYVRENLIEKNQTEIKELSDNYPQYSKEIMAQVEKYERELA